MHYGNGRPARVGDKVLARNGNYSFVGVVVDLIPGATTCNAYVTPLQGTQLVTTKDCLSIEDIHHPQAVIPDITRQPVSLSPSADPSQDAPSPRRERVVIGQDSEAHTNRP